MTAATSSRHKRKIRTPFERGVWARRKYWNAHSNPYPPDSPNFDEWWLGYSSGKSAFPERRTICRVRKDGTESGSEFKRRWL